MSQVVNAIMATKGVMHRNKQTKLFQDVFAVREDITTEYSGETRYKIGVDIGSQCWVGEYEKMRSGNALEEAIERTKRQVIEAIFGEFRVDFRMIERTLWSGDTQTACALLVDMEKRMFEVTE